MAQNHNRADPKRKNAINPKKKQFAEPAFKQQEYPHRLSFYEIPPTAEITLEKFEQWAIDRLRSQRMPESPARCMLTSHLLSSLSRARVMLVPQQIPRRDSSTYDAAASEIYAHILEHFVIYGLYR